MYSSLWLWIYVARKAHNVNQSQFKQSAGITVTLALLFLLLVVSLGQESFAAWTVTRVGKKKRNTCDNTSQRFFMLSLETTAL